MKDSIRTSWAGIAIIVFISSIFGTSWLGDIGLTEALGRLIGLCIGFVLMYYLLRKNLLVKAFAKIGVQPLPFPVTTNEKICIYGGGLVIIAAGGGLAYISVIYLKSMGCPWFVFLPCAFLAFFVVLILGMKLVSRILGFSEREKQGY